MIARVDRRFAGSSGRNRGFPLPRRKNAGFGVCPRFWKHLSDFGERGLVLGLCDSTIFFLFYSGASGPRSLLLVRGNTEIPLLSGKVCFGYEISPLTFGERIPSTSCFSLFLPQRFLNTRRPFLSSNDTSFSPQS